MRAAPDPGAAQRFAPQDFTAQRFAPQRIAPFLTGFAAYAVLFFAFGFRPGILASDDFGYLRSVLGTLEAQRPYVYDWLEPFGAVFSSACALLTALTGSLALGAWGFQAVCALAFYPLLYRLFVSRLQPSHAALLTLAVAAFPLWFAKAADFHAGYCTLDLFLGALYLHETRRFAWFFVVALLAFANRQNHICLLILPLWHTAAEWKRGRRVTWVIPAGFLAWGVGAFTLAAAMNPTYAAQNAVFRHASPSSLAGNAALALAAGAGMCLGWLALGSVLTGRALAWRKIPRGWIAPVVAVAALSALIPVWGPTLLRTDTPLFALTGWSQINRVLPWLLLAAAALADYRLLRPSPYLLLAAGYLAIVSLRGIWWDYYFLEIALLCLLLALDASPVPVLPRLSLAALALSLCVDAGYGWMLKIQSDKQRLAITVLERLERNGRITVDQMSAAPFGYLGWKLFGYFIRNEGKTYGELHDFLGYVKKDRVVIDTELPWRRAFKAPIPPGADSLGGGTARIGFATLRYRVADLRGPEAHLPVMGRPMQLDAKAFASPRFPLNTAEWKAYLSAPAVP